jgi:guanylate kinase
VQIKNLGVIAISEHIKKNRELAKTAGNEETSYRPLVICGPSGAGKGTLLEELKKKHPGKFCFSVSSTTRQPRKGEEHGVHYNFITVEKFKEMLAKEEFIEHFEVHGNFYGTEKAQIRQAQERHCIPLLDIDYKGSLAFFGVYPESNIISLLAPSI